jgi:hypothetical protein
MIPHIASVLIVTSLSIPYAFAQRTPAVTKELITVYRSKTCGCCSKWVEHLKQAGLEAKEHVIENIDTAPERDRVPSDLRSCHIAKVRSYLIEGHVPADVIKDLLKKKPALVGLAVPGMPAGSPGMESPTPVPYAIIGWERTGTRLIFAKR